MDVSWARRRAARGARHFLLTGVLGPMIDHYTRRKVFGREVFDEVQDGPVIFVCNHTSHLDTPTLLRSIPYEWRSRTAVAAAADYFYNSRLRAAGVALLFNTVPLGRRGEGLGNGATDHVDRLLDAGWSLVMFPEGTRSRDGKLGKLHSGAAVLAAQHGISIVPIFVKGLREAMPPGQNWPRRVPGGLLSRRHPVEVHFGAPITPSDPSARRAAMDEVRAFWEREGRREHATDAVPMHNVLVMHQVLRAHEARLSSAGAQRFRRQTQDPAAQADIAAPAA
jgi:1-acyl-sn-glycerol-3-phosphate acyltransferase